MARRVDTQSTPPVRMSAAQVRELYAGGRRDFHGVVVDGGDLSGATLRAASFYGASLQGVDLSGADLVYIQLKAADVTGSSFEKARVGASDLIATNFTRANLRRADFTGASLSGANCVEADLTEAYLGDAKLCRLRLVGANLTGVTLARTNLADMDVRPLCDVSVLKHSAPSYVDARTVMWSYTHPNLKRFLIDCGVPEIFAEYMIDCARALGEPMLRRLMQTTFISYGGPDEAFARRLYSALRDHGVVVFFFPETARVGERIDNEVFQQIQAHDRVLLVCSRDSLDRPGVLNEIQETLDREARDGGATYLLPIMLDDYVLTGWRATEPVLAERLGRRIIADFRKTRGKSAFAKAVDRVVDALKVKRVNQ
jgi:hypothetical protein